MKNSRFLPAALIALLVAAPVLADPPPWAPAHGWRKKNDPNYVGYTGKRWERDYGVLEGRCNTAAVGAVLGGMTGAVIAARTHPEDRPIAIVLGTAIGAEIDSGDRGCMGHALELAGESKTVVWTNQSTGITYRLTPTGHYVQGKTPCREFTTVVSSGKKRDTVKGVACRRAGGQWVFKT